MGFVCLEWILVGAVLVCLRFLGVWVCGLLFVLGSGFGDDV